MAALAMTAAMPGMPVLEVRRRSEDEPLWPMKPDPDNRGRRAEKDAIALAKAEAKRQRKAAKRRAEVGAGDTADKRPNVELEGPPGGEADGEPRSAASRRSPRSDG